jgi:hypothetical protein
LQGEDRDVLAFFGWPPHRRPQGVEEDNLPMTADQDRCKDQQEVVADRMIKAGASGAGKPDGSLANGPDALVKASDPVPSNKRPPGPRSQD